MAGSTLSLKHCPNLEKDTHTSELLSLSHVLSPLPRFQTPDPCRCHMSYVVCHMSFVNVDLEGVCARRERGEEMDSRHWSCDYNYSASCMKCDRSGQDRDD